MTTISEVIKTLPIGEATALSVIRELEGDGGKKLTVESRKLLPEAPRAPTRKESPRRAHKLTTAQSLGVYLARYGSPTTVVFVDVENEKIFAILDETSEEGFEGISMVPACHPLWAPWDAILDEPLSLSAFVAHLDKHRRVIVAPDSTELRLTLSQVRTTVHAEVNRGRGRSAVNGLMVTTKIEGGATRETPVDLPDVLTLKVPLYAQTEAVELELDLCLDADAQGGVTVLVTGGTVAEARVRAFETMVSVVQAAITEAATAKKVEPAVLTWGKPDHAVWDYLAEQAR